MQGRTLSQLQHAKEDYQNGPTPPKAEVVEPLHQQQDA
jgi:hypothetical protein